MSKNNNIKKHLKKLLFGGILFGTVFSMALPSVYAEDENDSGEQEVLSGTEVEGEEEQQIGEETAPINDDATAEYTVWFDGTMGLSYDSSKIHSDLSDVIWYKGATNEKQTTVDHKVTLPSTAGTTTNYDYTLNGWYDVTHSKYYSSEYFGKEVEVDSNTVFYADWISSNYNFGSEEGVVEGQPDTSSFIRTDVFDYNELFNLLSLKQSSSQVDENDHHEKWYIADDGVTVDANKDGESEETTGLKFAFLNWAYNQITKITNNDSQESIAYMNNRGLDNNNNTFLYQGIISDENGNVTEKGQRILDALFTTSDGLGRKYVGEGDYLYQFVDDATDENNGYYYYDSSKNGASYNQENKRFYVYKDVETIIGQDIKSYSSGWMYFQNDGTNSNPFLPFNDSETKQYNEKDGSINYWFGMKSAVNFWLPNNPGEENANIATTGKEMEFRFSGDDDVWVFVDDKLVLDLGGIHGIKNGSINFSKGTVTADGTTTQLSGVTEGDHTLTVYYLERGSSQSNCSIYFNIAPRYSLTLNKKDAETNATLKNAEFSVYKDEDCTEAAELWDSAQDCKDKKPSKNVFTTGEAGTLNCYGLVAGKTYYLKETKAPTGYEEMSDNLIKLTVKTDGITVEDTKKLVDVGTFDEGSRNITFTVSNTPKKISIPVSKNWADSNNQDKIRPNSVTVKLLANGKDTGKTLTLNEENKWFGSFTDLRQYEGETEITYTVEETEVSGYTVSITGDKTNGFVVTNTHTPEKVSISGSKTWDDADNQDGKRPTEITVTLYANGEEVATTTASAESEWKYSFNDLDKYRGGSIVNYTVKETAVDGYTASYDSYDITNTHTPETRSVSVTKVWSDGNNSKGERPDSVMITLKANGVAVRTVKLDESNSWKSEFTELPVYENGQAIEYTVEEAKVAKYTTTITGDVTTGFIITNSYNNVDTGDSSNSVFWAGMFLTSLIGTAGIVVLKNRLG